HCTCLGRSGGGGCIVCIIQVHHFGERPKIPPGMVFKGRGGLTTHGAPGNRGSWGPCVLAQTQKSL
ncbi:unnamed protein product, partial [Staurois parvus]